MRAQALAHDCQSVFCADRVFTPTALCFKVVMKSGSLFAWTGSLFHAGGGNRSDDRVRLAVNPNYHVAYLRQQENQ